MESEKKILWVSIQKFKASVPALEDNNGRVNKLLRELVENVINRSEVKKSVQVKIIEGSIGIYKLLNKKKGCKGMKGREDAREG